MILPAKKVKKEKLILGIDVGYSHTKVKMKNDEFAFKSTIDQGCLDISSATKIKFLDKEYTVGENRGLYDNEVNKIKSMNFKLCMYTAIAKAMERNKKNNCEIQLVTGLPAEYYSEQKEALKEELEGKNINITLNDKSKEFRISKVIVFPQSAGLFLLYPTKFEGNIMVIDIGGYTVDISIFKNKTLQKFHTYELGMNKFNETLVKRIKKVYEVVYDVLDADDITNSLSIIKDDEIIDITELINEASKKHCEVLLNRLNGLNEYKTCKKIFTGGGTNVLKDFLPLKEKVEDRDKIYDNARVFYKIGVEKFEKES